MEEMRYKTLWSKKSKKFVHFDFSPLTDEVIWGYHEIPQLMEGNMTSEMLFKFLGKNVIVPEGVELKTVKIQIDETEI